MRSLEDAAKHQLLIHQENDKTNSWFIAWRHRSLHYDYELSDGEVVHRKTGEPCDFNGIWLCGGQVLLCETCYEDAT